MGKAFLWYRSVFVPVCVYVVHSIAYPYLSDESSPLFSLPVFNDYISKAFYDIDIHFAMDIRFYDKHDCVV